MPEVPVRVVLSVIVGFSMNFKIIKTNNLINLINLLNYESLKSKSHHQHPETKNGRIAA